MNNMRVEKVNFKGNIFTIVIINNELHWIANEICEYLHKDIKITSSTLIDKKIITGDLLNYYKTITNINKPIPKISLLTKKGLYQLVFKINNQDDVNEIFNWVENELSLLLKYDIDTSTDVNAMQTIKGVTVVGLIQQTKDYSIFKLHPKNRKIDYGNVANIKKSMKIKNLFTPILVNEKMEIIDGQHRFAAWKELGLPVWFIVVKGYGEAEMIAINLYKTNWDHENYLDLHSEEGIEDYIKFKELRDKYNINYSDLLNVIDATNLSSVGENKMFELFDEGYLIIESYDKVIAFLEELSLFDEYKCSRETGFVKAFLKLYVEDFYDGEHLRHRIDINDIKLQQLKLSTILDYANFIAKILYTATGRGIRVVYDEFSKTYYRLGDKQGRPKTA